LNASLVLAGALRLLLFLAWLAPEEVHRNSLWFPAAVHSVSEIFALTVAVLVFAITWHSYRPAQPTNLLLLGCAFLAIALLDLAHTLSYRGCRCSSRPPRRKRRSISGWCRACSRHHPAAHLDPPLAPAE
jgi:hypothetical protein